eukprot:CAMPEP_0206174172 /NCGR_PEP_ID=MMETSP1474-20131121/51291_1 /ASSEMBLY_ACC=CAM_ASM_001110 /TAXON_ID=97495 /ORGANISM="Imantonia sp., Strain RCC918" /LENGTH=181 /DNA_ID=CAMNT_0053583539 /DNA_START=98 /DNA_END=640 /DNA_ORIENTATION=+
MSFNVSGDAAFSIGQIIQVNFTYQETNEKYPSRLALKLHPSIEAVQQAVAAIQALKLEKKFYDEDIPSKIRNEDCYIPISYAAEVNEAGTEGFIILEWMDDSKWELKDITQGCSTKEQTRNVLRALARVHGSHWGLNIPELYPWMHPLNLPAMTAHTIGGVSAGLPSALPNLEKVLSSELY